MKKLYEELEKASDKDSCRQHTIMGDFNINIGMRSVNGNMNCVDPFGIGNRNERGKRLLYFAKENNLAMTNSFFQMATNR